MQAITLDTSCALNFLGVDHDADAALSDLVGAAMTGRVDLRVSAHAFDEVGRITDPRTREQRLRRLRAFGRVDVAPHQAAARDRLAADLKQALFPNAKPGSRTDDHNRRDCLQLATHAVAGRSIFCTLDRALLTRAAAASQHGVDVMAPGDALRAVMAEQRIGQIEPPPSVSVRDATADGDEAAIREVLSPLAKDYPDFFGWLTAKLREPATTIRVGVLNHRIGAVAISAPKDATERVVKLSAFYVAPFAQDHGLGAHLLWSELRSWVKRGVEKVYVTVSSRHPETIHFLVGFGFMVEGISARRYQDDTVEVVLAKHLIRTVVTDETLVDFMTSTATTVFTTPTSLTLDPTAWAVAPQAAHPSLRWIGSGASLQLIAYGPDRPQRTWSVRDLERIFHPVRFSLRERRALLVPIRPAWADAMLEYPNQQQSLESPDKLLLRADNAYYCYPSAFSVAVPGVPILFFVTGLGLIGEARVAEAVIDLPEELFARFGGIGIYGIDEIRQHVRRSGRYAEQALGMRFDGYVPFRAPVTFEAMTTILGRRVTPRGITPIGSEEFELLRREGGLDW